MRSYVITGFIGPIIAFIGIIIAILLNSSWWSLEKNAISDMGRIGLKYWYVLDVCLIIAGIVLTHSAWYVKNHMPNEFGKYSLYLFLASTVLLSLIGAFPEGICVHWGISVSFFITACISLLGAGISMLVSRESGGLWIVITVILGFAFSTLTYFMFKGLAVPELTGAVGIVLSYYLLLYYRVIKPCRASQ